MKAIIFGSDGRIGAAITHFMEGKHALRCLRYEEGMIAGLIDDGPCVIVAAVPWEVAERMVLEVEACVHASHGSDVVVLDCSGFVKSSRANHRHVLSADRGVLGRGLTLFGNAGCIASATIETIKELPSIDASYGIAVVATGGASFVSGDAQKEGCRTGTRWLNHPHVKEIEGLCQLRVNSFVPIVVPQMDQSGILVVLSGRLVPPFDAGTSKNGPVEIGQVSGTSNIVRRMDVTPDGLFTAAIAIDNIQRIAWHAANFLNHLLGQASR